MQYWSQTTVVAQVIRETGKKPSRLIFLYWFQKKFWAEFSTCETVPNSRICSNLNYKTIYFKLSLSTKSCLNGRCCITKRAIWPINELWADEYSSWQFWHLNEEITEELSLDHILHNSYLENYKLKIVSV